MIVYRTEALAFFNVIYILAASKAGIFGAIFLAVYIGIFFIFLETLTREIWQTQSIINMIPDSILEHNKAVQEQVWKRRGVK